MTSLPRPTAGAVLLAAGLLALPARAQTVVLDGSERALSPTEAPADTPHWRVDDFGFFSLLLDEQHDGWRYPTWDDVHDPGYFVPDFHNAVAGDFNGDGHEDLVVTWAVFPHVVAHEADLTVSVLLNDGAGGLVHRPDVWAGAAPRRRHLMYRTRVADFNGDGVDDFVVGPQGLIERVGPGEFRETVEPVLLVLSRPDGTLEDASHRIEGQEGGGTVPGIGFSHDMSVGDVDGDGDADFMTAKHVFLNDGAGSFAVVHDGLPDEARPAGTFVMSSAVGDLNGDGVGDLVVCPSQGADAPRPLAWVLLSRDGDPALSGRRIVEIPDTLFGPNNARCNDLHVREVTGDGRADIVFALTRVDPYYQGRAVRVYVNHGGGVFVDESDARLVDPRKDYVSGGGVGVGEGNLHFADVDGDGLVDVVDSNGPEAGTGAGLLPGVTVFLNRGGGRYEPMDRGALPWVQPWQLAGFEGYRAFAERPLDQGYPVDLDGGGNVEFVTFVRTPLSAWPQAEPNEMTFYVLRGTSDGSVPVAAEGAAPAGDGGVRLLPNRPNPFSGTAAVRFELGRPQRVRVAVYDLLGRAVATLADGVRPAGVSEAPFSAGGLAAGPYVVRVEGEDGTVSGLVTVAR